MIIITTTLLSGYIHKILDFFQGLPQRGECFCCSLTQLSWPGAMTGSFVYLVFTFQHEIQSCLDSPASGAL